MSSVRKSLFLVFAQNYSVLILQFAASMIVARLLAPSELGVYSIAAVLIGLAQVVRGFGVPTYVVQEKELTEDRIRSAMGVAILVGWVLAGVVVLLSIPAAAFYRQPGVRDVMLVLSLNFLLMPFGSVTMALLLREMKFVPQAVASISSAAVQFIAVVGLAYLGFSYMSLAWASVASNCMMIIVAQIYRPPNAPYIPRLKEARRVGKFGMMSTSAFILSDLTQGAPDLIVGRMISVESVALLGRANGLIQMFDKAVMGAVWRVAMPYFSLQDRDGGDVRGAFLRAVSFVTALAWPFFIFLGLMSYSVIRILFGPQWGATVPLVPYLCIAGIIGGPFVLGGTVLIAIGQIARMVRPLIFIAVSQVSAVLVASLWGLEAVAASLAAVATIAAFIWYRILRLALAFKLRDFVAALTRSAGVTAFATVLPLFVFLESRPGPDNVWFPLTVGALGTFVGWIAGIFLLRHPFREEIVRAWAMVRNRPST